MPSEAHDLWKRRASGSSNVCCWISGDADEVLLSEDGPNEADLQSLSRFAQYWAARREDELICLA